MEVTFSVNPAFVLAVLLGELVSVLWYSERTPWGRHGGVRYFVTAVIADVGLAFLLQIVMKNFYSVSKIEDAVVLGVLVALVYACMEAPHIVHDSRSAGHFFYHVLHKFVVIAVMSFSLFYFRNFKL